MRRPRAEEILGEWGVRDVTPDSARERARLEVDRDLTTRTPASRSGGGCATSSPRPTTTSPRSAGRGRTCSGCAQIEDDTERHLERLAEAYAERRTPTAWRRTAERWNFSEVNDLIDRHNRWYPIEARLAMDPRSRDFVKIGGRPYRREPLDADWILERFPA